MRSLRVRAWDKRTNEMRGVLGYNLETQEYVLSSVSEREFAKGGLHTFHGINRGEDEIELYTYTGIKDSNGVEIYEGDILFHEFAKGEGVSKWSVVRYVVEEAAYKLEQRVAGEIKLVPLYELTARTFLEVKGNVENNKELLGELCH